MSRTRVPTRRTGAASGESDRRSEILQQAAAVFAERGFASSTVRDIATAVGILSGSLYHHFDSKETMVEELMTATLQDLAAAYDSAIVEDDPVRSLRNLFHAAYDVIERRPNEMRILHNDYVWMRHLERMSFIDVETEQVAQRWHDQLRAGQQAGIFRADLDLRTTYRIMMGSILATVRWFSPEGRLSAAQLADVSADIFLSGVLAAPPRPD